MTAYYNTKIPVTTTPAGDTAAVSIAHLKPGDVLSINQYVRLIRHDDHFAYVTDLRDNTSFRVSLDLVQTQYWHAVQFTQAQKVSRTKLIKVLERAGDTVFTVSFNKKVTDAEIVALLQANAQNISQADATEMMKYAKLIQSAGEQRILTGIQVSCEALMGRSKVLDLHQPFGKNERQVDHRTISWIIIKNVKYYC